MAPPMVLNMTDTCLLQRGKFCKIKRTLLLYI
jgi:hypothetical protein